MFMNLLAATTDIAITSEMIAPIADVVTASIAVVMPLATVLTDNRQA